MGKSTPAKSGKSITKSEFFTRIAEETGLKKTEVAKVFESITDIIKKELSHKGPGVLTLPGLFKLKTRRVPAQAGGKKMINRFTGEEMISKAKPASVRIRANALKGLKEMVK